MALNLKTETVWAGDSAAAQPPLSPAELAPHFPQLEIFECLGRGGMGVVYKARQKSLNRLVALKLLAPERVADAKFAQRFTGEAQALAALNHPSIVTIYDFGQAGGFYFLLMEFVDGVNLRQLLRTRKLSPEEALAIVPPLCNGLQYAHERGIVHRDIKPENLLLDKDGRIKIADFGIARMLGQADRTHVSDETHTTQASTAGTPGYMAPEQAAAPQTVDARADIYSLGVVFYEMLTGELPGAKLEPPSRKVQIDVRLDEIVLRALEQTPELRYATAAEFRTQIETVTGSNAERRTRNTDPVPRILKTSRGTCTTPEQMATFAGQFLHYRTRGQLTLDDRCLTHACGGNTTVIPLAAIRDVSIGQYPSTMNPVGIDLLSVSYEENGRRQQVLISPMDGFFAFPFTWNALVAEWHRAVREAVTAATGRAPATTPTDHLGVPAFSKTTLLVMMLPALVAALPLFLLRMMNPQDEPLLARLGPAVFVSGTVLLCFSGVFLLGSLLGKNRGRKLPRGILLVVLFVAVGLLVAGGFGIAEHQRALQPVVKQLAWEPVRVDGNLIVVNIRTAVRGSAVELHAGLSGPRLPAAAEEQLAALDQPKPATLVRSGEAVGNRPSKLQPAGAQVWQLGFVFPNTAVAEKIFRNLQARELGAVSLDRESGWEIFNTIAPDGSAYRGHIDVSRIIHSGNPNWVTVSGQSSFNETAVRVTWELLASQPGVARFHRDGNSSNTPLQRDPKTRFYLVPISVELTKAGSNSVLLVTKSGGGTFREDLTGNFRDVSAELRRTATFSAKTMRGASFELCQVLGHPLTVQVAGAPNATREADERGLQPSPVRPASSFGLAVPWFTIALGLMVLFILGAGAVMLAVLLRKRAGATRILAVLAVVGLLLFLLFAGVVLL